MLPILYYLFHKQIYLKGDTRPTELVWENGNVTPGQMGILLREAEYHQHCLTVQMNSSIFVLSLFSQPEMVVTKR